MKYAEIISTAIDYADRKDDDGEIANVIDSFLRIVEARINRVLKVQDQSKRAVMVTVEGQEYYGLPFDFSGLRDIEIRSTLIASERSTPMYLNPEQMNNHVTVGSSKYAYTIIDGQIQLNPTTDNCLIEIIYYSTLEPLNDNSTQETWLSRSSPDMYIFGLLVEISAFVKDVASTQVWDERFKSELANLSKDDQESRWSGTSLYIKLG